jgi:hypothetical protein
MQIASADRHRTYIIKLDKGILPIAISASHIFFTLKRIFTRHIIKHTPLLCTSHTRSGAAAYIKNIRHQVQFRANLLPLRTKVFNFVIPLFERVNDQVHLHKRRGKQPVNLSVVWVSQAARNCTLHCH